MTMLKVRRAQFPFGGSVLHRGDVIDTRDFPDISESKWNQLKNPESGRWFEEIDPPGRSARAEAESRATAELDRARDALAPDSSEQVAASAPVQPAACDQCDFVAKNSHGLLVHAGRRHKT